MADGAPADPFGSLDPNQMLPIRLSMPHPTIQFHAVEITILVPARMFTQVLMTPQLETDIDAYTNALSQAAEMLVNIAQAAVAQARQTAAPVILQAKNGSVKP